MKKRILIACEFSGIVREAFKAEGWDAWSCDLLPSEISGQHIQDDALKIAYGQHWDMMIAHPPCTYLANSGVTWLHKNIDRWFELFNAAEFFNKLLNADIPMICVENPIMHRYSKALIKKHTQIIQPWMFGHPEQKATCLWLKNLPELKPTNNVKNIMMDLPDNQRQRLHYLSPGPDRWKERSKTFQGIADAMAEQWCQTIKEIEAV